MIGDFGWFYSGNEKHQKEVSRAIGNLQNDSERGAAIVAATVVEVRLLLAIKSRLLQNPVVGNNLFQEGAPLGAFKPRIWLAFLLGIVSEEAMKELIAMADIRNGLPIGSALSILTTRKSKSFPRT